MLGNWTSATIFAIQQYDPFIGKSDSETYPKPRAQSRSMWQNLPKSVCTFWGTGTRTKGEPKDICTNLTDGGWLIWLTSWKDENPQSEKGIQFCSASVDIPVIELLMERYTEKSDNVAWKCRGGNQTMIKLSLARSMAGSCLVKTTIIYYISHRIHAGYIYLHLP